MHSNHVTYRQQYSFCSKPGCRKCQEGIGHGPYWYAYQTVQGRTVRTYIGKTLPDGVTSEQIASSSTGFPLASSKQSEPVFRVITLGLLRLEGRDGVQNWHTLHEAGWRLPQARALLGCLLSAPGRQLTQQQVYERLWPGLDKKSAAQHARRAGTALSGLLGSLYSKQTSGLLTLAGQERLWADCTAFEELLARARALLTGSQAERAGLLEQAIKLYGGDFFAEERDASWAREYRQRLHAQWCAAILDLADLYLDAQRPTAANNVLDSLLASDPTNEAAVQRLMFLLALQQRRVEAVQVYQHLKMLLANTSQATPSPETDALFHSIQQGDEVLFKPFAKGADGQGEIGLNGEEATMRSKSTDSGRDRQRSLARQEDEIRKHEELAAPEQPASAISFVRANQSPLVGRETEIHALEQLLDQVQTMRSRPSANGSIQPLFQDTRKTSRARLMVLVGEAGIGKTRLAEEAAREAQRRGWSVIWSRMYEQERGIPYRLWTAALRNVLNHAPELARQTISLDVPLVYQPLRMLVPEIQELLDRSEHPNGSDIALYEALSPEQEELRLREAIYTFLTTLSLNAPLLIVLDDIHWADDSSSQMLGYLTRRMADHPMVILTTCRETELAAHRVLSGLIAHMQREHVVELMHIQPLSDEHIEALVSGLPQRAITRIQSQVAGNPFFAEELAYDLRARVATDVLTANQDSDEMLILPDSIAAALNQRLKRLSQRCRELLDKAAVLGGSFDFDLIEATESNASGEDVVLDLLDEALESGVLTEEGSGNTITYHFWHPLLASHLYNGLSATRRMRLHKRIADVLRQIYQAREIEEAATITQHLIRGGAESPRIAYYAELAAHHAYSLYAYSDAERYYRLVLDHLAPILLTPLYASLLNKPILPNISLEQRMHLAFLVERLAECTRVLGNFQDAPNFYLRAIQLRTSPPRVFASQAEEQQEAQIQAILWSEIAFVWRFLGDTAAARESNARGSEVLQTAGITDGPAWGCLYHQQASVYWHEGYHQEALQASHKALDLFTACLAQTTTSSTSQSMVPATRLTRALRTLQGDPVDLGRVHAFLGIAYTAIGLLSEALKHLQQALTIYQQYGRRREVAHVCCNIGHVYLLKGEYAKARSFFQEPMSYVEQSGDIPLKSVLLNNMGEMAMTAGQMNEAEAFYRESLALAAQIQDREYLSTWNASLGVFLLEQKRFKEAAEVILHALAIGRAAPSNQPCIGYALTALANLYCALVENEHAAQTAKGQRSLHNAHKNLQRALNLGDLDAEKHTLAQLAQARVSYLLGDYAQARTQCQQACEAAQRYELRAIQERCQHLLDTLTAA